MYGWWLREGGLGLVRGGGGGDGGGIIGGGGGGGGGGSGGSGDGSSGQGRSNGGAIVFVAALGTFKSLWGQYAELLENQPVVTKAITAGLIALVGDVCAQLFEHKLTCRRLGKEGDEAPPLKIDLLRCLAVTIEGIAITGPGLHYLYSTLERLVPAQKGALAAITHVAVDEFIFDPLFVLGFFFLCGAIEGKDLRQEIVPQVRREYWPALKGGWMVSLLFLPLEFATFRCVVFLDDDVCGCVGGLEGPYFHPYFYPKRQQQVPTAEDACAGGEPDGCGVDGRRVLLLALGGPLGRQGQGPLMMIA